MSLGLELFLILLAAGLLLLALEVFVPGGILGTFGALAILGAIVSAFWVFVPPVNWLVTVGIIALMGIFLALWIRLFPKSPLGRKMTVSSDLKASKATQEGLQDLLGCEGETLSDLRPAGFALLKGRRMDVVSQGGMIAKGERVKVIKVEANRVIVQKLEQKV
ncbi:MAG: NfeD family protein [Kiritimatiellia bacterium]